MSLTRIGAWCSIALVVAFVAGIALMAASGVQVLIPETGKDGLDWIADVDDASGAFFVGAWLVIAGGVLGLVGLIGFYDYLRRAGDWLVLAPVLGAFGLTLVTISHLLPIAIAYELVPDFRAALDAHTFDALASLARVLNYTGDVVLWGVVVPMYALAILKMGLIRRWIGWLAVGVWVFAGLGDALSPLSGTIEGLTFIGFVGFFVWMATTRLRRSPLHLHRSKHVAARRGPEDPGSSRAAVRTRALEGGANTISLRADAFRIERAPRVGLEPTTLRLTAGCSAN